MIALIQRVASASVMVDKQVIASIGPGVLALVGIEKTDTDAQCDRLIQRLIGYRIFADAQERMNLALKDIGGALLLVPQFTLVADTTRGMRPGFSAAAPPAQSERLFGELCQRAQQCYPAVSHGQFGADMQVGLVNDGPVTFNLRCP